MKSIASELKDSGLSYKDEIRKNFSDAMKNECFSLLVSKLKLPEEKLMKYTTTLEECSNNGKYRLLCCDARSDHHRLPDYQAGGVVHGTYGGDACPHRRPRVHILYVPQVISL